MTRNGTVILNATDGVSQPNYSIYIGGCNETNTPSYFSTKQCAFAVIGDGLTAQNNADLYSAIQAFQTSLSRNV